MVRERREGRLSPLGFGGASVEGQARPSSATLSGGRTPSSQKTGRPPASRVQSVENVRSRPGALASRRSRTSMRPLPERSRQTPAVGIHDRYVAALALEEAAAGARAGVEVAHGAVAAHVVDAGRRDGPGDPGRALLRRSERAKRLLEIPGHRPLARAGRWRTAPLAPPRPQEVPRARSRGSGRPGGRERRGPIAVTPPRPRRTGSRPAH